MAETRTITVQALARVEGEGAFTIRLRDGAVAAGRWPRAASVRQRGERIRNEDRAPQAR